MSVLSLTSLPGVNAWRSLSIFALARALVLAALVLAQVLLGMQLSGANLPNEGQWLALLLTYFAFSCGFAWLALTIRRSFHAQVLAQFFLDLLFIGQILFQTDGIRSGLAVLLLMPLAAAGLLLPRAIGLMCAAAATLLLLGDAGYRSIYTTADPSWVLTGLHGVVAFGLVMLMNGLTQRAETNERLAREAEELALKETLLSQQVMQELAPGVIVFDPSRVVRAISPSARQLLTSMGIVVEPGDRLDARKSLAPLQRSIDEQSRVQGSGAGEAHAVVFAEVPGEPVLLVRVTEVARGLSNESDLVAFIEPAEAVAERAQRSKLAAMGRMSGSIAHEIRNPLASITQAAELLAQDEAMTESRANARLVEIVRSNAQRINHIIEDVLAVTRVDRVQPANVDVAAMVRDVALEVPSIGDVHLEGHLTVWFDPLHLRLTLINLLRNARRHARSRVSVRMVRLRAGLGEIQVIDDGPLIAAEVRTHLFEPFHTTERSGTGLGLYLAREYCVANRAQITYEERGRIETPQKMFVIRLRSKE